METSKIFHALAKKYFYIKINNTNAFLRYSFQKNSIEINSIEIPEAYRGKGIGRILLLNSIHELLKNEQVINVRCEFGKYIVKQANFTSPFLRLI